MWPKIGPVTSYGIFYFLGFLLHFVIGWCAAPALNLKRRWSVVVSICYVLGMIPGAKFLYHWLHVGFDPRVILSVKHYLQGGLWGGLLAYFFLVVSVALLLPRERRGLMDLAALALPIPWAVSKIGCLLNGCCSGRPCSLPWAITFPEGASVPHAGVPVHPTQIYEIVLVALLFVLFQTLDRNVWRGTLMFWFVTVYGLGRAATDGFRGDVDRYIYVGPVTVTQGICILSAILSLVVIVVMRLNRGDVNLGMDPDNP